MSYAGLDNAGEGWEGGQVADSVCKHTETDDPSQMGGALQPTPASKSTIPSIRQLDRIRPRRPLCLPTGRGGGGWEIMQSLDLQNRGVGGGVAPLRAPQACRNEKHFMIN